MIRQPPLFPQQNRPLPPWGRVGVGFACIPAGQCSPPQILSICRQAPTRVISTTSTPESVNPTPALPRRGREPIGGKTSDRSCILSLSGRFYGSGKMANATPPSPALSRTTRELFQSRCGLRPAREGAERRKCKQPLSMPQPIYPLPCTTRQRRAAGEGWGGGSDVYSSSCVFSEAQSSICKNGTVNSAICQIWFCLDLVYPHPVPPPLRASPCGGG